MKKDEINETHNVPQGLIDSTPNLKLVDEQGFLNFCEVVLEYRKHFPLLQGEIARWAFTTTGDSILTQDNDIYDAIRASFGMLEDRDYSDEDEAEWCKAEGWIKQARTELEERESQKG